MNFRLIYYISIHMCSIMVQKCSFVLGVGCFQASAWGMRMVSHFFIGTYAIDSCCVYMCQIKNGIYQLFYTS